MPRWDWLSLLRGDRCGGRNVWRIVILWPSSSIVPITVTCSTHSSLPVQRDMGHQYLQGLFQFRWTIANPDWLAASIATKTIILWSYLTQHWRSTDPRLLNASRSFVDRLPCLTRRHRKYSYIKTCHFLSISYIWALNGELKTGAPLFKSWPGFRPPRSIPTTI
jgi:hypothetical protein